MVIRPPALLAPAPADLPGPVRLRGLLAGGAVVAAGTLLLAVVDPNQSGHYPLCPFRALTGLACPGCGGLRAVHALTQSDLAGAFGHNPLVVLLLPAVVALWAVAVGRAARGRALRWRPGPGLLAISAAVVLIFGIVRNLPGVDVLGP